MLNYVVLSHSFWTGHSKKIGTVVVTGVSMQKNMPSLVSLFTVLLTLTLCYEAYLQKWDKDSLCGLSQARAIVWVFLK